MVKGAPEYVLPMCSRYMDIYGKAPELDSSARDLVLNDVIIGKMAKSGLRTIVYAYKDIEYDEWEYLKENSNDFENEADREVLERNLVFLAGFGLLDELRLGVE